MPNFSTNEFKPGLKVMLDGDPCSILENEFVKPGKGTAFTRTKLKNMITGSVIERTYRTGEKVEAAKPKQTLAKSADWRTYGPLQVDWGNWQAMGGSQVVPTLNAQGQALYLAVNCSAKKINATGADGSWKTWEAPKNRFEKDLVKDRCQVKV